MNDDDEDEHLMTRDEAIAAMMQRLTPLPKDPAERASAIREAIVWFRENVIAPRDALISKLKQRRIDLEQKLAELEARRPTRH